MNETIRIPMLVEEGALHPSRMTSGASGYDICAYLEEPLELKPGQRQLIPTGLKLAIPEGYEIQVRPRSGLAFKHGVTVLNTPGTIDSDYRGPLKVLLVNHGQDPFMIEPGMRIAQLIVAKVETAQFIERELLAAASLRDERGFGSTGYN